MNSVNKTLYIPLYGKAYVSRRGLFLEDKKVEEIWETVQFPLKGKSRSKWLAFYMGIRAAVFDDWVRAQMEATPDAAVIHLGCGMDSRALRVGTKGYSWYDVDFPNVIQERKHYFQESDAYHMIPSDVRDPAWMTNIPEKKAIVVMEGISMYLTNEELRDLLTNLRGHFEQIALLMDCYTEMAARMSARRNPINEVGVTQVYGLDDPKVLETEGFNLVREHEMTPEDYIGQLAGMERKIFAKLYAGGMSKKLYRLFEYERRKK